MKGGGGGRGCEAAMRVAAAVVTVAAAVIMGVDKQTTMVVINLIPGIPITVPVTAKSSYQSAFVYLVVANAIASAFAALSLILTVAKRQASAHAVAMKATGDLIMAGLLFSATGAAGAVGMLGYNGNSHVLWNKVCNHFGRFCHAALASTALSFVGSVLFFFLVLLAFRNLQRT